MRCLALALALALSASAAEAPRDVVDASFSTGASGPRATLRISKSHGLWDFLCALEVRAPGDQQALAGLFDESEFDREPLAGHLKSEALARLCRDPGSGRLWEEAAAQSAQAQSLEDFYRRLPRALPEETRRILPELEPAYERLVWQPSWDRLQGAVADLAALSRRVDSPGLFGRAAAFYRSRYSGRLLVAVAPAPGGSGGDYPLIKDVFLYEIPLAERGARLPELASSYGGIFHEMCHLLYDHKPASLSRLMRRAAGGRAEAGIFDETLALCLGNWAERRVAGAERNRLDVCTYDPRTCAFARALYPRVAAYLEAKRPMDEEFFAFAQARYRELPVAGAPPAVLAQKE